MSRTQYFDSLYRTHTKELLTFARQRAGNEATAEDLVQEAYARVLQLPDLESIQNPRAFLYKTTANLNIDLQRQQNVRDRVHTHVDNEHELEKIIDYGQSPEDQLALQQDLERLNEILMELPELTRFAFVLHRLEGFSYEEVSQRLGISVRSSERSTAQAAQHLLTRFDDEES